jgi:AraC-like DNA-binding protein
MKYTIQERVFLVKKKYELKEMSLIQKAWRTEFVNSKAPSYTTIKNIVSNFEKTGSVAHVPPKRKNPDPKREIAKNELEKMITEFPSLSVRKAASAVGVSPTLVYQIFTYDLHLSAYKFHQWHKLEDSDYPKRLNFAQWFLKLPITALFNMIFSDEAYFYLTLPLNKQNNRCWSESQPCVGIEEPLHDKKILVWCAISVDRVFGPYFFETTVNQHNYVDMLKEFFWPKILRTPDYKKYYFQQDGATPHTATATQTWLSSKFGKKFLKKDSWPPRSPDLNPCDYYLWGYLKARVYNPLPKTLDELKANITREIKNISKNTLKSVFLNFKKRCELIISAQGGHIEIE